MSNWCENVLRWDVTGEKSELIYSALKTNETMFSYNNVVKQPDDADDNWRLDNWGTTGDNDDECIGRLFGNDGFTFYSPWTPPTRIMEPLSLMFPGVKFTLTYDEPGLSYCGVKSLFSDLDGEIIPLEEESLDQDDMVSYMKFQKKWNFIGNRSYNGSQFICADACHTDHLGEYYLMVEGVLDKASFNSKLVSVESCEGMEYYSVESAEFHEDKITITALAVDGFDCKHGSLRLDFDYEKESLDVKYDRDTE